MDTQEKWQCWWCGRCFASKQKCSCCKVDDNVSWNVHIAGNDHPSYPRSQFQYDGGSFSSALEELIEETAAAW